MKKIFIVSFLLLSITGISNVLSPETEKYLEQYDLAAGDFYYSEHCCD